MAWRLNRVDLVLYLALFTHPVRKIRTQDSGFGAGEGRSCLCHCLLPFKPQGAVGARHRYIMKYYTTNASQEYAGASWVGAGEPTVGFAQLR